MIVLRARPFRSVILKPAGTGNGLAGAPVVSKRFHHPNRWLALFDGARARREFAALAALERAGLPVPHPLALRALDAGWEVELAAIEGARTLRELLDARGGPLEPLDGPPGGWARLAARLGQVLARLQLAGWEHGDLHPGNVLVDAHGAPWLIDLGRARRVAPDAARALSEVVHCAAAVRELLPARTRARFLVAWRRALPSALRPLLAGVELARAVEQRARQRRRQQVRIGLGRWLRESSRVRAFERGGVGGWARRDLADERVAALLAAPSDDDRLVLRGGRAEVRARWLGAARLHEHALPVARPALFVPGSRRSGSTAWALFEPPAHPAVSNAALHAELAERGLVLASSAPASARTAAGHYLTPPREPEELLELEDLPLGPSVDSSVSP